MKGKLIEVRKAKGFSPQEIADKLGKSVSSYHRREQGKTKMHISEWQKIAKVLSVSLEEIYEPEDSQSVSFNDNSTATITYLGTNNIYPIPDFMLESQHKFIQLLEKKIAELEKEVLELKMLIKT